MSYGLYPSIKAEYERRMRRTDAERKAEMQQYCSHYICRETPAGFRCKDCDWFFPKTPCEPIDPTQCSHNIIGKENGEIICRECGAKC